MSKESWDHIPPAHVTKLNALAEEMQYGSTTLGHQTRRHLALVALKAAYELGSSPHLPSAGAAAPVACAALEK